jgi:hypothetical protein
LLRRDGLFSPFDSFPHQVTTISGSYFAKSFPAGDLTDTKLIRQLELERIGHNAGTPSSRHKNLNSFLLFYTGGFNILRIKDKIIAVK